MGLEVTTDINFVTVTIAAVAYVILGMIWYSRSAFGELWMDLAGMRPRNKKEEEAMKKASGPAMFGSAVTAFITAYFMAAAVELVGVSTFAQGAHLGFLIWLGFAGAVTLSNHLYSKDPLKLFYVNAGYRVLSFIVMGGILASM